VAESMRPIPSGEQARPGAVLPLRLQILGPLRLWRDGADVQVGPRQQAFLLALLLAREGQPVSTSELIDLMWEEDVPASALNVLHKYVGVLRRLLEPHLPARESGSFLHRRGSGYLFSAGPGMLDLVTFRERVATARAASAQQHHEAALAAYVEALALWHGPAGDGLGGGPAALPVFAAVDAEFYEVCTAAADLATALARPERVLPALHLAASMAPLHEPVQAGLITTLAASGRQAEALSVFAAVRARLAEDLGIDPGPVLQAAHQRVLTQTAAPAVTDAHGDTGRPQPGTVGTLVGRAKELSLLGQSRDAGLAQGTAIGIIEGEPGVGKTRLLEEATAEAARRGALIVWGRCLEGDGAPSMWPWVQAVGTLLDGLSTPAREQWLVGELGHLVEPRDGVRLRRGLLRRRARCGTSPRTRRRSH